jgi:hypothetical protein
MGRKNEGGYKRADYMDLYDTNVNLRVENTDTSRNGRDEQLIKQRKREDREGT